MQENHLFDRQCVCVAGYDCLSLSSRICTHIHTNRKFILSLRGGHTSLFLSYVVRIICLPKWIARCRDATTSVPLRRSVRCVRNLSPVTVSCHHKWQESSHTHTHKCKSVVHNMQERSEMNERERQVETANRSVDGRWTPSSVGCVL